MMATERPTSAPVVFAAVNADYAAGNDADHIEHLAQLVDVLGIVECDFELEHVAPPGWTAYQAPRRPARRDRRGRPTRDEAKARSAIMLRDAAVRARPGAKLELKVGTRPWLRGRRLKMRTRYITCLGVEHVVTGEPFYVVVPHFAPTRFKGTWERMARRLRRIAATHPNVVILTDANMSAEALAGLLELPPLTWHGRQVMAALWNRRHLEARAVDVDTWGRRHAATDHPTVIVALEHRRMGDGR
jgi:hypothetical protein